MSVDLADLSRQIDELERGNAEMAEQDARLRQREADDTASTARERRVEAAKKTMAEGLLDLQAVNADGWPRHSAEEREEGSARLQAEFRQTIADEDAQLDAQFQQAIAQVEHLEAEANDAVGQLRGETLTRALQLREVRRSHVRMYSPADLWPQIRAAVAGNDAANRAAWLEAINDRIAELGGDTPIDMHDMAAVLRGVTITPETARRLKSATQRRDRLDKARTDLWSQTREVRTAMNQDELQADPRYARL